MVWLFWCSVALILYTYLGFPLLLWLRATLRPRPVRSAGADWTPTVSLIVAAYNEASVVQAKLANTRALDYPAGSFELIFASDGSDDDTVALAREQAGATETVLDLPRRGKNATLNEAVAASKGEILVFTDADSMLTPDTLRNIVAPFADPEVGGVGGDFRYTASDDPTGTGERAYWGYDRMLKQLQSRGGNMTVATGQLYAIRREHFRPAPDGVVDDFHTSVQPIVDGKRLVFEPGAVASGPIAETEGLEFRRKIRVSTRGLRCLWFCRGLFNPFRHGFYALQLASHKLFRWTLGPPIVLAFVSALFLWDHGTIYRLAVVGQLALHAAALGGFALHRTALGKTKLLRLPFYFDMVNLATTVAAFNLLTGRQKHTAWVPQRQA